MVSSLRSANPRSSLVYLKSVACANVCKRVYICKRVYVRVCFHLWVFRRFLLIFIGLDCEVGADRRVFFDSLLHSLISMSLYSRFIDLVGADHARSLDFNRSIVTLLGKECWVWSGFLFFFFGFVLNKNTHLIIKWKSESHFFIYSFFVGNKKKRHFLQEWKSESRFFTFAKKTFSFGTSLNRSLKKTLLKPKKIFLKIQKKTSSESKRVNSKSQKNF